MSSIIRLKYNFNILPNKGESIWYTLVKMLNFKLIGIMFIYTMMLDIYVRTYIFKLLEIF